MENFIASLIETPVIGPVFVGLMSGIWFFGFPFWFLIGWIINLFR